MDNANFTKTVARLKYSIHENSLASEEATLGAEESRSNVHEKTSITKTIIQLRRDTTDNWIANKDVVPAAGEPCFDIDTKILKIGDGVTSYENLSNINYMEEASLQDIENLFN